MDPHSHVYILDFFRAVFRIGTPSCDSGVWHRLAAELILKTRQWVPLIKDSSLFLKEEDPVVLVRINDAIKDPNPVGVAKAVEGFRSPP